MVGSLGLRYGLFNKLDIYTKTNYLYNNQRINTLGELNNNSDNYLVDWWFGFNYQFKEDNNSPALLGFLETSLTEKYQENNYSFKSFILGFTTYKTIDPIVFSLSSTYRLNNSLDNYNLGNLFTLNPLISFAVNDKITLNSGVQWLLRQSDKLDNEIQNSIKTSTDLILGVGYSFNDNNVLNITFKLNSSGYYGSSIRFNFLHSF